MSDAPDSPPPEDTTERRRRLVRRAAWFGAILAVACHLLPPEHREVCRAIANACSGGIIP